MRISEAVTTIICVAILFILVAVLFMVKDNMNSNNKKEEKQDPNKVVITYNINGGNETLTSSTIEKGSTIVLPTPTREGYKFAGWYVDGKEVTEYTRFDSNTTIVAKWILIGSPYEDDDDNKKPTPQPTGETIITKPDFKVSFNSNGGTNISSMTVKCNNTPLNLPEDPIKAGYDFNGWVDKNGRKIGNGSILKCEDTTLYATWKVAESKPVNPDEGKKYTVYFETAEGISVDPVVLECGRVMLELRDLGTIESQNRTYIFQGWYDEKGNHVTNGSTLECKDQTLHAKWIIGVTKTPIPR